MTGRYARALVLFLIGCLICWIVGIEGIYRHPTPFYAMFHPVFDSLLMPSLILLVMAGGYVLTRFLVFPYSPRSSRRAAAAFASWMVALLAVGVLVARAALARSANPFTVLLSEWSGLRWHLLALCVFAGFFALWWWLVLRARWFAEPLSIRQRRWFLFGVFAFLFCFSGSIAMLRGGPQGIAQAYERETLEYVGDIGKGLSIRGLFRDYAKMHDMLSIHAKVHPPGPIAVLWLGSYVVGRTALSLSLFTMVLGALAVYPLFLWVRDMVHERAACTACLLYALTPSIVLFNAASADIFFLPFILFTLYFFWRAMHRPSWRYAAAAGIGYALMSLMSYGLLSIGAFFGFVGLWRLTQGQWKSVFQTAAVMLLAFLGVHGAVWLWSGFNAVEVFFLCKQQFDQDQFDLDMGSPRYAAWVFRVLNPLAWVYFAGIPVTVLLVWRWLKPESGTKALFVVFGLTLVVLDITYLARGEGERSAMYVLPFMIVPAAHLLDQMGYVARSYKPLIATMVFLAFQCWLTESMMYTYW
ncbi:MAG: hypothetical protein AMXMBFR84_10510 [Candidatus Hydrogenedentota bacterium]